MSITQQMIQVLTIIVCALEPVCMVDYLTWLELIDLLTKSSNNLDEYLDSAIESVGV
jgi:hypothetical protein